MKKFIFLVLTCTTPLFLKASPLTVGHVTATSARMDPHVIERSFSLKPGDTFSQESYDKAQDELHRLRVFKKLTFSSTLSPENTIDIHIDAQDGYYLFPMAFISGGEKSAAGFSLAAGNLFKQGETSFLFAGGSQDGLSATAGLHFWKNTWVLSLNKLHFDQYFYRHHWGNSFGVFSGSDVKNEYKNQLLETIYTKKEEISLTYSHRFSRTLRAYLRPQYVRYFYEKDSLDSGNHHQLTVGIRWADDVRSGVNMGALAGYGLTDKKKSLQNLPQTRSGYSTHLFYTAAGRWSGSDYPLSKLGLSAAWVLETKNRDLFVFETKAQQAFNSSFSEEILSTELLSGSGRYDRLRRGTRGAGIQATWIHYLLRNQTGLLSVAPFYELAYVHTNGAYLPHSGAGATLSYRLWRFPLPFGINYTHNLQDGSKQIGFVIGGSF